jgi:hypothetical protein
MRIKRALILTIVTLGAAGSILASSGAPVAAAAAPAPHAHSQGVIFWE